MFPSKLDGTGRGLQTLAAHTSEWAGVYYCAVPAMDLSEAEARIVALMLENPKAPPLTVRRYGESVSVSWVLPKQKKPDVRPWYREFEKRERR